MNESRETVAGTGGQYMAEEEQLRKQIQVVCIECPFSRVVDGDGGRSAKVIIEHGRETGHKLTTEVVGGE